MDKALLTLRRERNHYRNALKEAIPLGITAGGARTVLEYGDMIRRGESLKTSDPFKVVKDFETELALYTGARYAVTTNSCTSALFLSLLWWAKQHGPQTVEIPARTYVSVPMVVIQAGHRVRFVDVDWNGNYVLAPTTIVDAALWLDSNQYDIDGDIMCISFYSKKPLSLSTGGGVVLHDDPEADEWFRRMRHDGRTDGKAVAEDAISEIGYHCPMFPAVAAEGLQRLSVYRPRPIEQDDYPDLRGMPVFQNHPMVVT